MPTSTSSSVVKSSQLEFEIPGCESYAARYRFSLIFHHISTFPQPSSTIYTHTRLANETTISTASLYLHCSEYHQSEETVGRGRSLRLLTQLRWDLSNPAGSVRVMEYSESSSDQS